MAHPIQLGRPILCSGFCSAVRRNAKGGIRYLDPILCCGFAPPSAGPQTPHPWLRLCSAVRRTAKGEEYVARHVSAGKVTMENRVPQGRQKILRSFGVARLFVLSDKAGAPITFAQFGTTQLTLSSRAPFFWREGPCVSWAGGPLKLFQFGYTARERLNRPSAYPLAMESTRPWGYIGGWPTLSVER